MLRDRPGTNDCRSEAGIKQAKKTRCSRAMKTKKKRRKTRNKKNTSPCLRALLPRHTAAVAAGQSSRPADRCNVKRKVPVARTGTEQPGSLLAATLRCRHCASCCPVPGRPGTSYPLRYDQSGNQKHRDGPQRDTPAPCRPVHNVPCPQAAFTQHPV